MSKTDTNFKEGTAVHKGKLHQWYKDFIYWFKNLGYVFHLQ